VDLFLAISQGVGVSLATGVRTFLPPLLVGALARADAGVDFDGTGCQFLESVPWLLALVLLVALVTVAERARIVVPALVLVSIAAAIAALEFAGSLADDGYAAGAGFPAGVACALIGFAFARAFFGRAASRARSASLVELFAQLAAVALAAIAVFLSPLAWLALAFAAWVLLVQRRRAGQKYEGLRILR